ncbi:MAG TPA: carboxypeptidase regulatory-like domain-containing protein [Bryobacteraceae bacterium]
MMGRVVVAILAVGVLSGQSTGVVEGTLRDAAGKALSGATVSLQFEKAEAVVARVDADGRYRFTTLRAGSYMIRAQAQGKAAASFGPFVLRGDETKTVDLTLAAAAAAEFYDEPNFTVAGVTDTINRGGHGSDSVIRSSETVTKAAAALSQSQGGGDETTLRAAIARDPQSAVAHHALADFEERRGNSLEAVREYQRAAEIDASETNLFDWGAELLKHRAAEQSAAVFAKGNRLFPRSTRMLLGLGAALYARGAYDEAARRFFEATDLNPGDSAPYLFLGKVENTEITGLDGYLERMARFAKLEPDDARANYLYGAALWKRDRPAEAVLEKAVRIDPTLADAFLQLGILHSARGDFSGAIGDYQKAVAAGTEDEQVHYRLAQAYQRTGEAAKAREEFAVYERLTKTAADEAERERRRIQQFVFDLRKPQ